MSRYTITINFVVHISKVKTPSTYFYQEDKFVLLPTKSILNVKILGYLLVSTIQNNTSSLSLLLLLLSIYLAFSSTK